MCEVKTTMITNINTDYSTLTTLCGNSQVHYADDVVILNQTVRGLQPSLRNPSRYCQIWKLQINVSKNHDNLDIFKIGDKFIQDTDRVSYFGFMLTPSNKFNSTVNFL